MKRFSSAVVGLLAVFASVGTAAAQFPLTPNAEKLADQLFKGQAGNGSLSCDASPGKPFFDFSFRFEAGFLVHCPYKQFSGNANRLIAVLRIRSGDQTPLMFGDMFAIPALPESQRPKFKFEKFKGELEFSGAVAVGEGDYVVELLVADDQFRIYRKQWKAHAERRGAEKNVSVSLQPGHVAPLLLATFNHQSAAPNPLNITVLLNAAPINPYSSKLRIWDRAFLLGSVASLIRQVPAAKVRLVAFNTQQQVELFHAESLDKSEFLKLGDALRTLELGIVSYKTLERPGGGDELLDQIIRDASPGSDAVVILGPQMRQYANSWHHGFSCDSAEPPVFYLKYFASIGAQFPDSIDSLTKTCKGRVLAFHTPGELGTAIERMRESLVKN